jgi:hypothetical protein
MCRKIVDSKYVPRIVLGDIANRNRGREQVETENTRVARYVASAPYAQGEPSGLTFSRLVLQ